MLLVDDLAAGGTKNLRHTPRGLVTLNKASKINTGNNPLFGLSLSGNSGLSGKSRDPFSVITHHIC